MYVCMYTAYPFSIVQEANVGTTKVMLSLAFQLPTVLLLKILMESKKHFFPLHTAKKHDNGTLS